MISYNYIGDGTKIFTAKEIDKKLLFVSNKLKDHNINEDIDIYRFHGIKYYDNSANICHETHYVSNNFKLPVDMSKEDSFKVLSFIIDNIDSINNFEKYIENIGFEVINEPVKRKDDKVIELFKVTGKIKRFKISKYYDKYFNWYINNVTKENIDEICYSKQKVKK